MTVKLPSLTPTTRIATVLCLQAALLLYLLTWASRTAPMPLEARPLLHGDSHAPLQLVDTINIFCGRAELGMAAEDDLRRNLLFDNGHFTWVVLEDRARPGDRLWHLAQSAWPQRSDLRQRFTDNITDGILNFFYDTGGAEGAFRHNWSAVGVAELQMSPLLPWNRSVDFAVLSCYHPDHCAGLRFIARRNREFPVIGPRGAPASAQHLGHLLQLESGLHRLSPRLCVYVYQLPGPPTEYCLACLLHGKNGWVLLAGVEGMSPEKLIQNSEKSLGEPVSTYIGATGWRSDAEDEAVNAQLLRLRSSHPHLSMVADHDTAATAQATIHDILGDAHYQPALLGSRIAF